uniref:Uncharacterized protein n=1 Tax=Sphaerodactylus townsendi TaxID=933632 RepID=A0ACB8F338_9SAUR
MCLARALLAFPLSLLLHSAVDYRAPHPMPMMELTSPERRMTADEAALLAISDVGVLADFAKAVGGAGGEVRGNGEEAEDRRGKRKWASFMQSQRPEQKNSELSHRLRLAIDRGMTCYADPWLAALLQRMGSLGGRGAGGGFIGNLSS